MHFVSIQTTDTLTMVQNVVRKARTLFVSIPSVLTSFQHPLLLECQHHLAILRRHSGRGQVQRFSFFFELVTGMRPEVCCACGLEILVYEAFSCQWLGPAASSVCLQLLV
jgi:hypothetical protein